MEKLKTGIFGASGYAGWELFQLLSNHPGVDVEMATSETYAGQTLTDIWPNGPALRLLSAEDVNLAGLDCVFLCLPHTTSAPYARKARAAGVAVIDLSADLRLEHSADFTRWYQSPHAAPELLPVVYGLPEFNRERIQGQAVIANPGCYPTAILLGLLPLAQKGLLVPDAPIIVDAKSGTTGAGRKASSHLLHSEMHGNFYPYKIGREHQHIGEIEQALEKDGYPSGNLIFCPHLLPVDRGILASIYVRVTDAREAIHAIHAKYQNEPLVKVLPQGQLASLAHVVRTPYTILSVTPVEGSMLVINVAIDNLLKGAASQAVQNFNLMFDLQETTGLLPVVNQ